MGETTDSENMKTCRCCRVKIDEKASKCPHCQAFQSVVRNPQVYAFIPLAFVLVMLLSTGLFRPKRDFTKFANQFSVEFVSSEKDGREAFEGGKEHVTFRISNETKHKWSSLSFQLIGMDENGDAVVTRTHREYGWVVPPAESRLVTGDAPGFKSIAKWQLQILDLESGRPF